ncbi:MAG: hypothetical protein COA49_02435 [Bacteroidetes bacterium]|nr:MAG: hypothetical protein COA49_02435 [Bacteroidota bacterium]
MLLFQNVKETIYLVLIVGVFTLGVSGVVFSQGDTTWVSTYTWESQNNPQTNYDSPGRRWFEFPSGDNGTEYRKVLMYHNLKCFDQGTAGGLGYACGEWDYLTYNYLFDHTGELDSTSLTHPQYKINNSDFEFDSIIFSPLEGTPYDTILTEYDRYFHDIIGTVSLSTSSGAFMSTDLISDAVGQRLQMVWSEEELSSMGVEMGVPIKTISLEVGAISADLLTLRYKWTNSMNLENVDNNGWTTVFQFPVNTTGLLELGLSENIVWDGVSDLKFDLSFENLIVDQCEVVSSPGNSISFVSNGGYVLFDGGDKMELDVNSLQSLSDEITLECWLKGDQDWLPANTTIFEGVNAESQREINVHLPWSNSRIYWDAGYSDGGYDRIDKQSSESEFEGTWSHWAFSKNVQTQQMKVYRNGLVWHEGSDKDNAFGEISKMFLGSAFNGDNSYRGGVEDFRIWSVELSEDLISQWMYKSDMTGHPFEDNLMAVYNFDGDNGTAEQEDVGSPFGGYYFGNAGRFSYRATELFLNPFSPGGNTEGGGLRAAFQFIQGDDSNFVSVVEYAVSPYFREKPPVSVSTWVVNGNDVDWVEVNYGWPHDQLIVTYNELGDTLSTYAINGDIVEFSNSELIYFSPPFEVVDRYELGRFITPYGINLSLGSDGWTWIYDVTDYLPLLRDSVELECGNWQELLDLKFAFIEGTPPRDIKRVEAFWNGTFNLNTWNEYVLAHSFTPEADEEMFRLVTRASGHWFGQGNNCGEFCYNTHSVNVNGAEQWSWEIMQECADNPLYPQGGTWIYDRAAWCPGAPVVTRRFELTPLVEGLQDFSVEYDVTDDPYGNYRMEGQIIAYGAPNMTFDVELMDIVSPNNRKVLSRWNPVCEDPVVRIRNNGSEPLVSCTFLYGVAGEELQAYEWTPDSPLSFLETAELSLPYDAPNYTQGDDDDLLEFTVNVELTNGLDEEEMNGQGYSYFRRPPTWSYSGLDDNRIIIWTKTNNNPFETLVELTNRNNTVIWSRTYDQANTIYRDTLELNEGCYRVTVTDYDDDGLEFWANNDGGGYVRIKKVAGGNFLSFESDFGKSISQAFRFETNLISAVEEVIEITEAPSIVIFPNPTNGSVKLKINGFENSADWVLRNALGQEIDSGQFRSAGGFLLSLDFSDYNSGMYSIVFSNDKHRAVSWIIRD